MTSVKNLCVLLAVSSLLSDVMATTPLHALIHAGTAALPIMVAGSVIGVPKVLLVKGAVGTAGLKIAGLRYLKEKVLVPASLAGAVAGYRATSKALQAPQHLIDAKNGAVQKIVDGIHSIPKINLVPSMPTLPAFPAFPPKDFEATIRIPALPVPSLEWYRKPVTLQLPKLVLEQPAAKTITITKTHEPAYVPQPEEVIVERPY